jgi:hypothetical protein
MENTFSLVNTSGTPALIMTSVLAVAFGMAVILFVRKLLR